MKHLLSIFLLLGLQTSFVFGQTKLLIAHTALNLDGAGQVMAGDSQAIYYNGQLQNIQSKHWNLTGGVWVLKARITDKLYDADDRILQYVVQGGNDTDGWTNLERYTNTYDANGNQLSNAKEKWDGTAWVANGTTTWVYDANGRVISEGGTSYRSLFAYNAEGLLDTKTEQQFIAGNWQNYVLHQYAYLPGDDQVQSEITSNWGGSDWVKFLQDTYTYDANGNEIQKLSENWNEAAGAWENFSLYSSNYDANHNLIHWLSQNWDGTTWQNSIQQFNEFDAESYFLTARLELWAGVSWTAWLYGRNYYAEFVSTNAPAFADFEVFPNPAAGSVILKSEGLAQAIFFDMHGRPVHSQNLQGHTQETLQLGNLPSGNYILQVFGKDGETGAKPLLIKR